MSRIGKKPIEIPQGTEVKVAGSVVSVKGPLGTVTRDFGKKVSIAVADGKAVVALVSPTEENSAIWGTTASHLVNMVNGVNKLFEKRLIVEGIGFKADIKGSEMTLSLGFSHTIPVEIPKDLKVVSDKNGIGISGVDIEKVGHFAAKVRSYKVPEPYKGKGIRYSDEVVRRKQGKKTV